MKLKKRSKIIPLIGMQWGDEGKGRGVARIASKLAKNDLVVRFQGGNNAGHTIWHRGQQYVFHLIPSGIFGKAQIHLGAGMVIDPIALKRETKIVPDNIPFLSKLSVSPHALLVLPTHLLLDSVSEKSRGKKKIGSTGKGISPSYTDLTLRRALRVGDIFHQGFRERYRALTTEHYKVLRDNFGYTIPANELKIKEKEFFQAISFLKKLTIKNSADLIEAALFSGHKVIAEGAQGTLLDVRFGNYPYVTSSHTIAGGISTGLGIPPSDIGEAIGIIKAYSTRVGEGPFPTELGGKKSSVWCRDKNSEYEKTRFPNPDPNSRDEFEQGIALRRAGSELGATTGRLRRCGWLDLPLIRYAIKVNNVSELILNKLDILNDFKKIKVCTSYVINGKKTKEVPYDLSREKIKCVYETLPGWQGRLQDYGKKLPPEALRYVKFLEKTLGKKIIYIGIGPENHHVVERYWR